MKEKEKGHGHWTQTWIEMDIFDKFSLTVKMEICNVIRSFLQ